MMVWARNQSIEGQCRTDVFAQDVGDESFGENKSNKFMGQRHGPSSLNGLALWRPFFLLPTIALLC